MAPAKKKKATPFEAFLDAHEGDQQYQSASEIPEAVLHEAYAQALEPLPWVCQKEREERTQSKEEASAQATVCKEGSASKSAGLQSEDSDFELVNVGETANKKKRNGANSKKAAAATCSKQACAGTPACLNWSGGEEEWGSQRSFIKFRR